MPRTSHLEIVPLGGLGEFGMNLMVFRWGDDCIVVDTGMMFPGAEHLGIDVVIPSLSFLDDCRKLHGVILTHGHEDHIGALPYLLARHHVPVWATPYTLALVRRRLAEHALAPQRLLPLPEGAEPLRLGPFVVETIRAGHSIPQCRMLVVHTPAGIVVHTGDFKLDPGLPDDEATDLAALRRLGQQGVLALLSDSTNADRPGFTPSETRVVRELGQLVAACRGRVVVSTFASHVRRIGQLGELAVRHGRKLALIGASMEAHAEVAQDLGVLALPAGLRIPPERVMELPPERVLVVAGGSQGEPMSSMARIAIGRHRDLKLDEGDLVIHSARAIPANATSIGRMINHLLRRGADVVTADDAGVHVSGHPSQEELRLVLDLVRPRFFVPIHGEYRQLRAHARIAADAGLEARRICLAESGDLIAVGAREIRVAGRVPVGQVFIDAISDEVDWTVLRDRRRIAGDGIVVPVVAVGRESGVVNGAPRIFTRGFVPDAPDRDDLMRDAQRVVAAALVEATPEERSDEGLLRARIQTELRRFLRRRTQRKPLILPVIVEL